jgi:hypothetical protein
MAGTGLRYDVPMRRPVLTAVFVLFMALGACGSSKRVVDCQDNPSDGDRCTGPGEGYVCRQGWSCYTGCASVCDCVAGTWRCRYLCQDLGLDGGLPGAAVEPIPCGTPPLCWRVCGSPPPGVDAGP